jgi:hypothetical protein
MQEFEAPLAFAEVEPHAVEIRVNFGVFAGREATPAELDDLARALMYDVGSVTIVSEQRHEVGHGVEAAVHQVRVELDLDTLPPAGPERDAAVERLVGAANGWARACIEERAVEAGEL